MPLIGSSASHGMGARLKSVVAGGTLTSDATYFYRTFTGNGTLDISGSPLATSYLVVAGGGGGRPGFAGYDGDSGFYSNYASGGGGAGSFREIENQSLQPGSYAITVGGGGASTTHGSSSGIRLDGTLVFSPAAAGGSYGGHGQNNAFFLGPYGSGGGGASELYFDGDSTYYRFGRSGGTSTFSEDKAGGTGFAPVGTSVTAMAGGGGGGADSVGGNATSGVGGNGGGAKTSTLNGIAYAGGGGGAGYSTGGTGGAGAGNGAVVTGAGGNATANRGGGGGGGGHNTSFSSFASSGGSGGSGIVIVRYLKTAV
jgi:MSHA biogenesis protein MshQ